MVTLNFYSLKERKPAHKEHVMYLEPKNSWGMLSYAFSEATAEYCWFCRDSDGYDCGQQELYDPTSDADFALGDRVPTINDPTLFWVLDVMLGDFAVDDLANHPDILWMPIREFWAAIGLSCDQTHSSTNSNELAHYCNIPL